MRISIGTEYGKWTTSHTGKGLFINRLIPELRDLGADIVKPAEKAEIDLQLGKYVWKPDAKVSVIRMGCPHFNDPKPNERKAKAVKKCDAVIYQSEYAKKWCDKLLGKAKRSVVINNGATPDIRQNSTKEKIFIACTRIWNKKKKLNHIVKAFREAYGDSSKLWIFGKAEKKYKFPNVHYKGSVSQDELKSYYLCADVMVHLCERDACSNSVVEAMCHGCRVITNYDAGTKELLTDKDIVIGDYSELPRAMRKIQPERMYPEKLDIKNVAKRYYEFFEGLL